MQQKDITFVNSYALDMEAPKYIKQILTDLTGGGGWIDSNTITVGDFNISLTSIQTENQ